ncbi:MAG: CDP-glycerol glycerophosphotransferase family protein [Lactovum sp.]
MKIKALVLTVFLSFFYPLSLISKFHKNRVTFISLEHDNLSKDFKLIYDKLVQEGKYEVKTLLFKFKPGLIGNIKYGLTCIRQIFALNNSRLIIIDYNNFVISRFKHRKRVKILQIWHATGAIKKFGNSVSRDYKIQNYDYTIVASEFYQEVYSSSFNIPKNQISITGIPLNDQLFDLDFKKEAKEMLYERYPILQEKKVLTYAPTFRGRISKQFKEIDINFQWLKERLSEDYILIYKSHPLISNSRYANDPNILFIEEELTSWLFCITDILVTDYSALTIDWMIFDKPVISFAPDFEKYNQAPGFVFNYLEEFPGPVCFNEEDLLKAIKQPDLEKYKEKRQKFIEKTYQYKDGQSLNRVINLINQIMNKNNN